MKTLIFGGHVIDPANRVDGKLNILVEDGKVAWVGTELPEADRTIDATGKIVTPGFVDRALTGDLPDWDLPDKLPATDVRPPREDINEARSKIKGFNPDIPLT